jgi:hypothetical protein
MYVSSEQPNLRPYDLDTYHNTTSFEIKAGETVLLIMDILETTTVLTRTNSQVFQSNRDELLVYILQNVSTNHVIHIAEDCLLSVLSPIPQLSLKLCRMSMSDVVDL